MSGWADAAPSASTLFGDLVLTTKNPIGRFHLLGMRHFLGLYY